MWRVHRSSSKTPPGFICAVATSLRRLRELSVGSGDGDDDDDDDDDDGINQPAQMVTRPFWLLYLYIYLFNR